MTPVVCNQCKKRFGPALKLDSTDDGGERWWFQCPSCHHRYEVAAITARGVALRAQLEQARRLKAPSFRIEQLSKAMAAEVSRP